MRLVLTFALNIILACLFSKGLDALQRMSNVASVTKDINRRFGFMSVDHTRTKMTGSSSRMLVRSYSIFDKEGSPLATRDHTSIVRNLPQIHLVEDKKKIASCFQCMKELRPHLEKVDSFVEQVVSQQKDGYKLANILEGEEPVACVGYRFMETLAWNRIIYIDDLITREKFRSKGYGSMLLKFVIEEARNRNCNQVHLDSGYTRFAAHKVYLNHGFEINCHHFALRQLTKPDN